MGKEARVRSMEEDPKVVRCRVMQREELKYQKKFKGEGFGIGRFKRLTYIETQNRRSQGLCFRSDEKFSTGDKNKIAELEP